MGHSIFDYDDTLCQREGNRCKRRNKCLRFNKERNDNNWVADYFSEFGKFCDHFIPMKGKHDAAALSVRTGKQLQEREDNNTD